MDLQEQLELGRQAEQFYNYLNENPYFKGLIDRVKLEYCKRILLLRPEQKDEFAGMKERLDVWDDEIMNAVLGDISNGAEALKQIEGVDQQKGLL